MLAKLIRGIVQYKVYLAGGIRKSGLINTTGKEITPVKYDHATAFAEGMARVNIGGIPESYGDPKGGKWGFRDKTGKEVIAVQYDKVKDF